MKYGVKVPKVKRPKIKTGTRRPRISIALRGKPKRKRY